LPEMVHWKRLRRPSCTTGNGIQSPPHHKSVLESRRA
jgi:hypothetical protein